MIVQGLSQRVEADKAMYARTALAAGDPRHDVDLIVDAQVIPVLEPFGEIDDRRRHQHDPRPLRGLAVNLIELLRQLIAIARIQQCPANVAGEQIVARIKFVGDGIDLEGLQISQHLSFFGRQVRLAEIFVDLLI
jgi:hypothetical protein